MDDSRELIDRLYMSILRRPADESGIETYTQVFKCSSRGDGIAEILHALITSAEFQSLNKSAIERPTESKTEKRKLRINGLPVSHIISLGTHCLTSYLLKKHNLKRYSLPFDWLFSSPETVLHCLSDDFATLMDERHFISVTHRRQSGEPGADHSYFRNHHNVHDMFAHRDPCTPDDYLYFVKAIKRFRSLLKSSEGKLFVMICRPDRHGRENFSLLSEAIARSTTNCSFICIQLNDPDLETQSRSMNIRFDGRNHALYEFTPSSKELGIGFDNPLDDMAIMQIVDSFDIDLKEFSMKESILC